MTATKPSLALLETEANIGYGQQPLPSERDAELRALLENASAAQLVGQITFDRARVLRVFAERAASLSVRSNDARMLRTGLTALALADPSSRETMLILPLYCDAAQRIGIDARVLFGAVGNLFGEPTTSQLNAFLKRAPQDRSLASMGYDVTGEGLEFRYSRNW